MTTLPYHEWFEANRHELRTRYFATHDDPKGIVYATWCEQQYAAEIPTADDPTEERT